MSQLPFALPGPLGADATGPLIVLVSPSPNEPITKDTVIVFDVLSTIELQRVIIYVVFTTLNLWEVVYDGDAFGPSFSNATNTVTTVAGGREYRLLRDGGWPQTPVLRVFALDASGYSI
jgi:hypothetical protein